MTITYHVNFGQTKLGRLETCLNKVLQVELLNLVEYYIYVLFSHVDSTDLFCSDLKNTEHGFYT